MAATLPTTSPERQSTSLASAVVEQFGQTQPQSGTSGCMCTRWQGATLGASLHMKTWPHQQRMWSQPPSFSMGARHRGQCFMCALCAALMKALAVSGSSSALAASGSQASRAAEAILCNSSGKSAEPNTREHCGHLTGLRSLILVAA